MKPTSSQKLNTWSTRMVESTLQRYTVKDFRWHYEHGLLVLAIQKAGEATGEERYLEFSAKWVDHFIRPDGSILTYRADEYNIDQINAGRLLYSAYDRTGEERYRKAIDLLRDQMRTHPRNHANGFWHKQIYPYQMWLDGAYMAGPFLSEYALRFNEPEIFDEVIHQIMLIEQNTRDPMTGLLYHAWDESKEQRWCNPETGQSRFFWGRGVGWFVMALVDILDYLPQDHARRSDVIGMLCNVAAAIAKVQDEATGLWYQVLDLPKRAGNYLEASGSAMFVYAFAKAVNKGYISQEYLLSARRGYHGLLQNLIKIDPLGLLTLEKVCSVAGLGGEPYRDGSFEYYVSEKTVSNDPKGVGPFILASLEMERAGLNGELTL
jgi:unsaturated rhamnogalacturonyl hydrolase